MSDVLMEDAPAPAAAVDAPAALPSTTEAVDEPALPASEIADAPAPWIGISGFLIDSQRKVVEHCRQQLAAGHLADPERERLERVKAVAEAELGRLQPPVTIPPGWVDRLTAEISAGPDAAANDPPGPVGSAEPAPEPTNPAEAAAAISLAALA